MTFQARSAPGRDQHVQRESPVFFDPPEVDLGRSPWFTRVPFELTIRNASAEAVVIRAVVPSCGCTQMHPEQYAGVYIGAGEALTMPGELDLEGRPGVVHRSVDVLLEDGRSLHGGLLCEAYPTYTVQPSVVDFGRVSDAEAAEPVSIAFRSESGARVLRAEADAPWLRVAVRQVNGTSEVVAALDGDLLPSGTMHCRVILYTDDPHRPNHFLSCLVNHDTDYRVTPSRLVLRTGESRRVVIRSKDGARPSISDVNVSDTALTAEVTGPGEILFKLRNPLRNEYATAHIRVDERRIGNVVVMWLN